MSQYEWDSEIFSGPILDDPGPPLCRCGWPLIPCQGTDVIPEGYDYMPWAKQVPGDPCIRVVRKRERAA